MISKKLQRFLSGLLSPPSAAIDLPHSLTDSLWLAGMTSTPPVLPPGFFSLPIRDVGEFELNYFDTAERLVSGRAIYGQAVQVISHIRHTHRQLMLRMAPTVRYIKQINYCPETAEHILFKGALVSEQGYVLVSDLQTPCSLLRLLTLPGGGGVTLSTSYDSRLQGLPEIKRPRFHVLNHCVLSSVRLVAAARMSFHSGSSRVRASVALLGFESGIDTPDPPNNAPVPETVTP